MTAHKHAEIIKAKADNMDLVVFAKHNEKWIEVNVFPEWCMKEYFLCLPQNKDACLHWLNGGEVEMQSDEIWMSIGLFSNSPRKWLNSTVFMQDYTNLRIKPRKEKRWIAFKWDNFYVLPRHYETKEQVESAAASTMMGEFQYKEIEVEI